MKRNDTNNTATRRSWRIVELLAGRFFDGLSNKELAEKLGTSPANASRDMSLLEDLGMAHKLENGRWSLTAKPLSIMQAYVIQHQSLQSRMEETTQNIVTGARRLAG